MRLQKRCILFIGISIAAILCIVKILDLSFSEDVGSGNSQSYPTEVVTPNIPKREHLIQVQSIGDSRARRKASQKTILLWTKFFSASDYIPPLETLGCPKPRCVITSNRSELNQSDALIFHLRDMSLEDIPPVKYSWQRWILLHHESPPHTPNILRYVGGLFNWTATYRFDSDILLTPVVHRRKEIHLEKRNFAQNKTRLVAWLVSNCQTPSNREGFVKELQKSIPVDVFGSCGTKTCLPKMSDECYRKLSSEYRYYLALENSLCKDYVTEKFYHILNTDMVPVVMGGVDYTKVAPPGSYIDALSFNSPRELAHFLLDVAKNDRKYNSFFNWRRTHEMHSTHYACEICRKLHSSSKSMSYKDLHHWWFDEANCKSWSPDFVSEQSNWSVLHD